MKPTRKQPLFIVTGASCAGKSTVCEVLFQQENPEPENPRDRASWSGDLPAADPRAENEYIVMESDLLWHAVYDTPQDNYCAYRRLWMQVAANISQIGKPVVLCGCAVPEQFENQPEREFFTQIHYLAIVCDDAHIRERLSRRQVTDEGWIGSSLSFNAWLKNNAHLTTPEITLLDTSALTPEAAAGLVDRWVRERLPRRDTGMA